MKTQADNAREERRKKNSHIRQHIEEKIQLDQEGGACG